MANYYATVRTNYFSVKDAEKFREIVETISAEDNVVIFDTNCAGDTKYGFGCYGSIYGLCSDDEDADMGALIQELQAIVSEGDAIIIMESGYEKLRYVIGTCMVITSTDIQFVDMHQQALELSRKMLGNPNYDTRMDY